MTDPAADPPTYPVGLRLAGRKVLLVGGGNVAQRRAPSLIAAGADVHVVSPDVTPAIEGLVGGGEVTWHRRGFEEQDLDEAWYVIAATDDRSVNERVSAAAEERRIFCVRSDDAPRATAEIARGMLKDNASRAVLQYNSPLRASLRVRQSPIFNLQSSIFHLYVY